MPYLMLNFEAVKEAGLHDSIKLKMIDTDNGKVVELSAEAKNVKNIEREPTWAETQAASKTLGRSPGDRIAAEALLQAQAERDSYRQKTLTAQAAAETEKKRVQDLRNEIAALEDRVLNDDAQHIVGAALDRYIEELALNQEFEKYDLAKKIYKHMTGMAWVLDDDEDPDDEEGEREIGDRSGGSPIP